jgi:Rps23 Pro-64 3,4-dihydroxylase Tpa1-like proline 4-hydroxylase
MPFHFDAQQLRELAAARHATYVAAQPFPHIVIDDFLPVHVLDEVVGEFPSPRDASWMRFESDNERKLASTKETLIGEASRQLLSELNSATFIEFLEELTGISGLIPDPHFEGGGLHQIVRGGHLGVHVDFNRHPRTGLERRLNALVYLNRDWKEEYGGALELWSRDMQRCQQRILPVFNRLVVFSTSDHSYHGHPNPLECPEGTSRRSLALYYYSLPARSPNGAGHNTVWQQRPGEERPEADEVPASPERLRAVVRRVTPPVVLDLVRVARHRPRTRD